MEVPVDGAVGVNWSACVRKRGRKEVKGLEPRITGLLLQCLGLSFL